MEKAAHLQAVCLLLLSTAIIFSSAGPAFKSTPQCSNIQVLTKTTRTVIQWTCALSYYMGSLEPSCSFQFKTPIGIYSNVKTQYVTKSFGQYTRVGDSDPWYRDKICTMEIPVTSLQPTVYTFTTVWGTLSEDSSIIDLTYTCNAVSIVNTGLQTTPSIVVTWKCNYVFVGGPSTVGCNFYYKIGDGGYNGIVPSDQVGVQKIQRSGSPYSYMECTMTVPINELPPGRYTFLNVVNGLSSSQSKESSALRLELSTPNCTEPVFLENQNNKQISMTCWTSGPYSNNKCLLLHKRADQQTYRFTEWIEQPFDPNCVGNPPSCSLACVVSVDVTTLGVGEHTLRVYMKPVVVPDNAIQPKASDEKKIRLTLPVVELRNCPSGSDLKDGYIKEGTTATCQCHLNDVGNPPGQPQWSTFTGQAVNTESKNTIRVQYTAEDPNLSYVCTGVSPLGRGTPVTFTPTFAYGPSYMLMKVNNNKDFIKCEDTATFDVSCDFNITTVNPKPQVTLEGLPEQDIVSFPIVTENGLYKYLFKVKPTAIGEQRVTCVANNAIFTDMNMENARSLNVKAPPDTRPVMTVGNGQAILHDSEVNVTNGQSIVVTCRVEGGYPAVTQVTVMCGQHHQSTNGIESRLSLIVNSELDQQRCVCSADHETNCYRKTTEFTLNVQYNPYSPTISQFTANSQSNTLDVNDGDMVTLSCTAEGYPRPTLTIKGKRSDVSLQLKDETAGGLDQTSSVRKTMGCMDTDTYVCTADNGAGDGGMEKHVSVFVKCPPKFLAQNGPDQKNSASLGDEYKIRISIFGHPKPTEYVLTKDNSTPGRLKRELNHGNASGVMYNATYEAGLPPTGTVVIRMFDLRVEDSGRYLLTIGNGIEPGLGYGFTLDVKEVQSHASSESGGGSDSAMIAGAAAGAVFVLVLIVLVAIFILKRKGLFPKVWHSPPDKKKTSKEPSSKNTDDEGMTEISNDVYGMEIDDVQFKMSQKNGTHHHKKMTTDPDIIEETPNVVYGMACEPYPNDYEVEETLNVVYGMACEPHPDEYEVDEIPNVVYGMVNGTCEHDDANQDTGDYTEITDASPGDMKKSQKHVAPSYDNHRLKTESSKPPVKPKPKDHDTDEYSDLNDKDVTKTPPADMKKSQKETPPSYINHKLKSGNKKPPVQLKPKNLGPSAEEETYANLAVKKVTYENHEVSAASLEETSNLAVKHD